MKILYFDILSGISGDMVLSALLNLLSKKELKDFLKEFSLLKLPIRFSLKEVKKKDISALQLAVIDKRAPPYQPKDFIALIKGLPLKKEVKELSLKILNSLITAESKVHKEKKKFVHFHQIGDYDTLLDIIGTALLIDKIAPQEIYSSPIVLGKKKAFATLEILKNLPVYQLDYDFELTTPTGAAIIKNLTNKFIPLPLMKIEKIGYGAGHWDLEIPNILRVIYGELIKKEENIILIETNLDHLPPLIFENLFNRLFQKGALEVFITPVLMKKLRPAYLLTCLCQEKDKDEILKTIFSETETLGIRYYPVFRKTLKREIKVVNTQYGKVRVKIGELNNKKIKNFEYEDIKKIAERRKIPLLQVYKELAPYLK